MAEPIVNGQQTQIRIHPERAVPDEAASILAQGMVAHVGFIQDDYPVVIPMSYHYGIDKPELLYLHGSIRSRLLQQLATGPPVCVAVTLADGLVYSRKAMNHSMNYRSVVVFGNARQIVDESEKFQLFDQMVQRYFPGRKVDQDYHAPPSQDLEVTSLIEVTIKEWSAKARRGGPTGPEDDRQQALGSAGIVEMREF